MIPALSVDNLDLIRKLYALHGWTQRLFGLDRRLGLLRQIEANGQVAAVFSLFHFLDWDDQEFARAVAASMHRLFQKLSLHDFLAFDEGIRRSSWNSWNSGGYTVVKPPRNIAGLARFGDQSYFLVGIFSCHADGHTREAAVRVLAGCKTGEELPFVLVRLNDWVENVRKAAADTLDTRIHEQYIVHFVKFLPLVLRLTGSRRQDHRPTIDRIKNLFVAPEAASSLEEGMCSPDRMTRRFCYSMALSTDSSERLASLVRRALAEKDVRIALDAIRALSRVAALPVSKEIIDLALGSSVPTVRLEALRFVIEKFSDSAREESQKALLDRNSGVRQQAQFYLQKSGGLNVCDFYVKALSAASSTALPVVLAGLGESCSKSQIELVKPYMTSERSIVRARALQSIASLDRNYPPSDFLKALEDGSNQVVRVASIFLRRKINTIGGERLWEIHQRLANPRHRRWTLFLLAGLTKWESIYYLIQSLSDQSAFVAALARRYRERWLARYNDSLIAPSKEQLEKLKGSVREYELLLNPTEYAQMVSLLNSL